MENNLNNISSNEEDLNLRDLFFRYFSFWKYFLISVITFIIFGFLYLRYTNPQYQIEAKIEILDKAQDSDMALPSAMTIFNRSMINLENETGVLSSYQLHDRVVSKLNSNVKFYNVGKVKSTELHIDEFLDEVSIDFKSELDNIQSVTIYEFNLKDEVLVVKEFNHKNELKRTFTFESTSTNYLNHDLPFDISIIDVNNFYKKKIVFHPRRPIVELYRSIIGIAPYGKESDHLILSLKYPNKKIAVEYLNTLINEFDKDGISDRQLEHKTTMDFAESRSDFLMLELDELEKKRQEFKQEFNLTDIKSDAQINITQKYLYDGELFTAQSQRDLLKLLDNLIKDISQDDYKLLPINIGVENTDLNFIISEYNKLVNERSRLILSGAGPNNSSILNINNQIKDYFNNVISTLNSIELSLDNKIEKLQKKENQFSGAYSSIPENEKVLRSIERELNIKESLFLLLLQKREEAAINFAVIKPSIKVIDFASSSLNPVFPNKIFIIILSIVVGLLLPFSVLFLWFKTDNKIHTREDVMKLVENIPILSEVPHIDKKEFFEVLTKSTTRNPLAESIRMLLANLKFVMVDTNNKNSKVILVTSSIKGEGKTLISTNVSSALASNNKKVILIGADLRNPQIHKIINIDRNVDGLTEHIYKNIDYKNLIIKQDKLDIILSGTIPPNPSEILASNRFMTLIETLKKEYDYIIIDSAPTLLVSDTFEISKVADLTLYIVRSNYTSNNLFDFINENSKLSKLPKINIVINSVGNSKAYGYKYGYQYGYKYNYRYGYKYNYGYGYGYEKD